ncbi:MAG TPA: hypothetical protein PKD79_01125 [Candidatus Doudnabacteria bacterium]|nr:hypothetical protein [Candidatus Doudnabacteria bacterium]
MKRINLLPQPKQSEIFYEDIFRNVVTFVVLSVAILLLGILAQVGVWVYLEQKEARVIAEVSRIQQSIDESENAQLKQEVRQINVLMSDFENLSNTTPEWSKVLKAFTQLVPNGVRISEFNSDVATGIVDISGYAPTREAVIELYNNINGDKINFKDINYPLENVAQPTNIIFNFRFSIQEGILVPKIE